MRISFQSVGVVIAALIIYFYPNLKWVDPVCTFLFSILVLGTTVYVLKDIINILMEGKSVEKNCQEEIKANTHDFSIFQRPLRA